MNKKSAGVPGDIPMKLIAEFSFELSRPIAHIVNYCFTEGVYPDIWKLEYVTPVPKVYPPENLSDLRRISGLLSLSKITDKIIAEIISQDMQYTTVVSNCHVMEVCLVMAVLPLHGSSCFHLTAEPNFPDLPHTP